MTRLTLRTVEAAEVQDRDYIIWDDDLPGFGLRVFKSGKRSYLVQYRALGRSRRYSIGLHGVWTPQAARKEAKVQLGRVAKGENPAEERKINHKAITVKELCELYVKDLEAGLILGKGGRPKKPSTVAIDKGRVLRHIVPLLGARRVQDLTRSEMITVMNNITVGKTRAVIKTKKLRGKAIVRGGPGAARRTIGFLGGILTYAVNAGIIDRNPVHGIQRPKGNVRERRLSEADYRTLGAMLNEVARDEDNAIVVEIIRQLALTGCRRSEIVKLKWAEIDFDGSCLRLSGRLADYAARKRVSQAFIVETAVASFLSPDGSERLEAAISRRLDRQTRQNDRLAWNVELTNETLALFIRFWLTTNAPLPDTAMAAAQAMGRERWERFVESLSRRMEQGPRLAKELSQDIGGEPDV